MHEFFWFILGALAYKFLAILIDTGRKYKFIHDIRVIAFRLIGQAFKELEFSKALKYSALNQIDYDKEKLKQLHLDDETFIANWKKEAVESLNLAVPSLYKNAIDIKDWKELMVLVDTYYKDKFKNATKNQHL
jgi:hypothetical protein